MAVNVYIVEALVEEVPACACEADGGDGTLETRPFWRHYEILTKGEAWLNPENEIVTRIVPGPVVSHDEHALLQMVICTSQEVETVPRPRPEGEYLVVRRPANGEVFVGDAKVYHVTPRRATSVPGSFARTRLAAQPGEEIGPDLAAHLLPFLLRAVRERLEKLMGIPVSDPGIRNEVDRAATEIFRAYDPYELNHSDVDEITLLTAGKLLGPATRPPCS